MPAAIRHAIYTRNIRARRSALADKASSDAPVPLGQALEDHSAEGAEILYSEPAPLIRRSIWLMVLLLVTAVIWSVIGHVDVVVSAPGVLTPEQEVRRVYAPTEGELEGVLVQEGDPIAKGDAVARIRSPNAIQLAVQARQAEIRLAEVALRDAHFEAELALMEQEAAVFANEIRVAEEQLDRRVVQGSTGLRERQRARLSEARGTLDGARNARVAAKREWDSFRELRGEAVPEVEVERARLAYQRAEDAYRTAAANLRALESEFIGESEQDQLALEKLRLQLEQLRIEYGRKRMEIDQAPLKMQLDLDKATADAEAARQVRFEIREDDNMLIVLSPVSGTVTEVTFTQAGDKVQSSTPLVSVAPMGARKMLKVDIAERDAAFLEEGAPVKLKFNAFPYQRYGFLEGTLEYMSPTTQRDTPDQIPSYKGYVSLAREHFEVDGKEQPLRYGMAAVAEIIVRERRVIDMVLDPLRGT
jgi:hemolysin D